MKLEGRLLGREDVGAIQEGGLERVTGGGVSVLPVGADREETGVGLGARLPNINLLGRPFSGEGGCLV